MLQVECDSDDSARLNCMENEIMIKPAMKRIVHQDKEFQQLHCTIGWKQQHCNVWADSVIPFSSPSPPNFVSGLEAKIRVRSA